MRFKIPSDKDQRIVKRFAIFPIIVRDEVVWLETCYIEQQYEEDAIEFEGLYINKWNNMRFATKEEYDKFKEDNS